MNKHSSTTGPTRFGWLRSLLAFRHQSPIARVVSVVAAFAAAVLLVGVNIAPAQAATVTCTLPGGFEIEGDMIAGNCDNPGPGDDWSAHTISASDVASTSQGGTYKTANDDTSDPSNWTSSGSTPDKGDFGVAYSFAKIVDLGTPQNPDLHYFVYVAWERDGTSGTGGYVIELDNSAPNTFTDADGNVIPQPDRSLGGSTYYLSATGGAAPTLTCDSAFADQSEYGPNLGCPPGSTAGFYSAINDGGGITDAFSGLPVDTNGFYEVALDVTTLTGVAPSCPGPDAASLYIRSLTGEVKNGNLKGYLEPLTLQPDSTCVVPHMDTTATPGGNDVALGSSQTDVATVGVAGKYGVGDVAFYLCSPAEVTANGGDCSADGTLVSTDSLDINGQATSDAVSGTATGTPGTYCWRAEFTPGANDHNYLPGSHTNSGSECFTVIKNSPTITTQIDVTGTGLGFTTLGDTATLHGYYGDVSGEDVTFKLYGPYADGVTPDCSVDDVVAAATNTSALNGSGVATSATYKPTAVGTYVWIASYPGDSNNDPIAGTCAELDTESTTIGGVDVSVAKSATSGTVSAGDDIGFDITVTNNSNFPATGVHVTDTLPAGADGVTGGDLDWSLPDPGYTGCSITGLVGAQSLDCTFAEVAPGSLDPIHITSHTSPHDCGVVSNEAFVSTTNGTGGHSSIATINVQCPAVTFTKTADAASVNAGSQIGFTITASNSGTAGTGTAHNVVINDPLPAGNGVDWSIAPGGPGNCTIDGAPPTETLHCTAVDLAKGATESVHVVSQTSSTVSCAAYPNTATLTASNATAPPASATIQVVNCVIVSPPQQQPHPHVLPNTGGPDGWLFAGGLALLLSGGTLVLADQRRKRRS